MPSVCFYNSFFGFFFFFPPHFPLDPASVAGKSSPVPIIHASIHHSHIHPSSINPYHSRHIPLEVLPSVGALPPLSVLAVQPRHICLTSGQWDLFPNNNVITHPDHISFEKGGQHPQDIVSKAGDAFHLVNVRK